jgi:alkylation response protein AidB-like acyl-CoA dehydrogenase
MGLYHDADLCCWWLAAAPPHAPAAAPATTVAASQAPTATLQAAMAKRYATDTCYGIANDALQLLGGYGYLR